MNILYFVFQFTQNLVKHMHLIPLETAKSLEELTSAFSTPTVSYIVFSGL